MLYVLYGTDRKKGKEKLEALISALHGKRPDAARLRFDEGAFAASNLEELIYSQGLFSSRSIIALDGVLDDATNKEALLARVNDIASSENIFVVLAGKLDTATKTKLQKHAQKVQTFDLVEKKDRPFNTFSLADAFAERDSLKLWTRYHEAKLRDISDEEIHGLLFWQVKSLLLAAGAESAKAAGLNPFVYGKAARALRNYSRDELRRRSFDLVRLYHDARRGKHELGSALEQFIVRS